MQATGLSEDGKVAIRPRWVWCVRSWWKNVGRKAGKEGASSACEIRILDYWVKDVEWLETYV